MNATTEQVTVAPLELADIPAATRLHVDAIPYSMNSMLGPDHVATLYRLLRADPHSGVFAARRGQAVVGTAVVTTAPSLTKKRLIQQAGLGHWVIKSPRFLLRPSLIATLLQEQRTGRPVHFEGKAIEPVLAAIAVAPDARTMGVGRKLLAAVEAFLQERGEMAYRVDTRADNDAARAFYRKAGFAEVEQRGKDVLLVRALSSASAAGRA